MKRVRSRQHWFTLAFGSIVVLAISGCPTHPPVTPATQIRHFTATPNPVAPGGVTRLSWHATDAGIFAGTPSCSLGSHTYGADPEPAVAVDCQGTGDFTITANVSFQLNVLDHPYDPDDPQPYLTQALLVTTTATPVTVGVQPASAALAVNTTQPFTATVTGATDGRVTWGATCGGIAGTGNTITYTAPATAGICTLTATSVADPTRSQQATIDVQHGSNVPWRLQPSPLIFEGPVGGAASPPQPITIHNDSAISRSFTLSSTTMVSLTPTTGTLAAGGSAIISVGVAACPPDDPPGTTTSTITATGGGGTGTASVARTCGEVVGVGMIDVIIAGLPTGVDADVFIEGEGWRLWPRASVLLPDMPTGTYQMTANAVTSGGTAYHPTPTSSTFMVTAGAATPVAIAYASNVIVTLDPSSAYLSPGAAQSFTATVAGTTNTAVSWDLTSNCGTLSGTGNTRTYTAPGTGPASCTLTATSVADPTRQDDAAIAVQALPAGQVLWTRQFGSNAGDWAKSVALDASGNVIVAGYTGGSLAGGNAGLTDAFVRKYDPNGSVLWTRQFGSIDIDWASGVAVDASGNVLVVGATYGSLAGGNAGEEDAFVRKYDPNGNELWTRQFGSSAWDWAHAVAVDASANVLVAGQTFGSIASANAGSADAFVRKYDADGNELWSRQFGNTASEWARGVAVDASGNVLVAGETSGSLAGGNAGGIDAFVRKYDPNGTVLWTRQFGSSGHESSRGVAVDASGNVLVAGETSGSLAGGSAGGIDAFVRKYDPNGTVLWTRQFGSSADDVAHGVAVGASGSVHVAGSTQGSLAGGGAGGHDAFVRAFDADGSERWTRQFGSGADDLAFAVGADAVGNILVAGETSGSLAGGSSGGIDAFVQKLSP
jgi:hypothetical protein